MKLNELARLIDGEIKGDPDIEILGVSGLEEASASDITFVADRKSSAKISSTRASAIIVREDMADELFGKSATTACLVTVRNPVLAFAKALEIFYVKQAEPLGISDRAILGSGVKTGTDISIHPGAIISSNVTIGDRVTIFSGVFIGDNVQIGNDTLIYPNVTIRENISIGNRVIIHPGTVIGSDGFGYVMDQGAHVKIPQVGSVIIGNDVEIGANVTIDRATVGNTIIGSGTKIDNLVQIAHNVTVGKNCIIVAQTGIGGSAKVGDGVIIAGQVGVRDHVNIGDRAMIGAQSGITSDIPEGGVYTGYPAMPHKVWLRAQSIYAKLPEYIKILQKIDRKLHKED